MSQATGADVITAKATRDDEKTTRRGRRRQNGYSWHLKKAEQGPRSLAVKNHFVAMLGEYVGTTLFLLLALGGTNVANSGSTSVTGQTTSGQDNSNAAVANTSNLLYIALSFGFSLTVSAWIFFRVSGGLFNPAVSLGMALVGALEPVRALLLSVAQILGGITGAAIVQALVPGPLNAKTSLSPGVSVVRGLFIEMFCTALLMLAILLLAAEKNKATFIAPVGIGLALFIAELFAVYYTGGSLNPARSFGPCVVLKSFHGYHWIYWLGPALGSVIAAGFYKMLKYLQYETVLGPEVDSPQPLNMSVNRTPGDEEKAIEGLGPRTMAISGPGLADLLTQGSTKDVFDVEAAPTAVENRLERIESMLAHLTSNMDLIAEANGPNQATGRSPQDRISSSTYVEPGNHQITPVNKAVDASTRV